MLSEHQGCQILHDVFTARGYAIARDVAFDEPGVSFDIDGWDADARVGFEYRTSAAGDHDDLTDAELAVLAVSMDNDELAIFIVDDTDIENEADLRLFATGFLDALAARRATRTGPR